MNSPGPHIRLRAGTLERSEMRASCPHPGTARAERQPEGSRLAPSLSPRGLRRPLRVWLSPALREQLPLLFPGLCPALPRVAQEVPATQAHSSAPAPGSAPPQYAPGIQGPKPLTQKRTRSRPSAHLWGCPASFSWSLHLPGILRQRKEHPEAPNRQGGERTEPDPLHQRPGSAPRGRAPRQRM
jgi:hypothetical protein